MRDKSSLLLAFNWFSFVTFLCVIVATAHVIHQRTGDSSIDFFTRDTIEFARALLSGNLDELNDQLTTANERLARIHERCRQRLLADGAATSPDSLRNQVRDLVLDSDHIDIAIVATNDAVAPLTMATTGMSLHVRSRLAPRNLYLQLRLHNSAIDLAWQQLRQLSFTTQMHVTVHAYLATRDSAFGTRTVRNFFDPGTPVSDMCAHYVADALDVPDGMKRIRAATASREYYFAVPVTLLPVLGTDARIVCQAVVDIGPHVAADKRALKVLSGLVAVFVVLSVLEFVFLLQRYVRPLHASRQMLETVLDTIPVRVFWKDAAFKYLGCNRQFAQDTGLASPKDIVGKTDHDLGGREFADIYRADDRAIIESGVPKFNYEEPSVSLDGHAQWLRSSKAPLRAPTGDIIGVLGTFEDITEQKRAKEDLLRRLGFEQALARLSACLLDTANIPNLIEQSLGDIAAALQVQVVRIFNYDSGDGETTINVAFQWCEHETLENRGRLVGVQPEDFAWSFARIAEDKNLVIGDINCLPPEAAEERARFAGLGARAFLAVPIHRAGIVCGLVNAVCVNGPRSWREDEVGFFTTCVQIIGGAIERHEIHADLRRHHDELERTVRHRTEDLVLINDQLRESQNLYASTVNSLRDWVHVVDRDMCILFANDAFVGACRKFGFDTRVIGANLFELMPFLDSRVREEYLRVFATGKAIITQDQNTLKDHTVFTETKKTPVVVNGVVDRVVTFIEDITERKMAEQALRESEARYRTLFDSSPVGVAEQDWSLVKHCLDQMRDAGVDNLDAYLTQHPDRVMEFWSNFIIRDANLAMQQIHGVASRHQLVANIDRLFPDEAAGALKATLLAMSRGDQEFEMETIVQSPEREKRHVAMKWRMVPGYEATYAKVVLSLSDITERKRAEQLVRQSEQKFSATFQLSPALMAIVKNDTGSFLEVNDAYVRNTGYSREELMGKRAESFDIWSLAQREEVRGLIRRDGMLANFEMQYRTRDGSFRTGLLFAEPLNLGGTPCMLTMAVDITDRVHANEELQTREAQYRALFVSSPIALWQGDFSRVHEYAAAIKARGIDDMAAYLHAHPIEIRECLSRFVMRAANNATLALFDAANAAEMLHRSSEMFCEKTIEEFVNTIAAMVSGKTSYHAETAIRTLGGATRRCLFGFSALPGAEKTFANVLISFVDISARTAAEEQRARFAALVESSNEFIGMADLAGYVTYLNRAGRELVGLGPEDDVSRTRITDYVPEEQRESLARDVLAAVKSLGVWSGDGVLRNFQTKALVDVAIVTFVVPPPIPGAQPCIATVMRNITARKRADAQIRAHEQQLRSMASEILLAEERERRRIAAGLHDDVCQTLAVVKMKLGMMRGDARQKKACAEIAASVELAIASLRSLVFDLSPPALYELGLGAALEWLADRVHRLHGIACTFAARTNLGMLDEGTRTILYLSTRELVMNVVKHAAARRMSITADILGESLCIVVTDNGRGIAAAAAPYDTFGLFSVRERLRYLGGTLDIQSQKGKGTTAVVAIPLPAGARNGKSV